MSQPTQNETHHPEILLLAGDKQNLAFNLLETFRIAIGRHGTNDIALSTRKVSNYHAEILNEAEGLLIRDLSSTNGTYVNGERIRERRLKSGDRIGIGAHEFKVHLKTRHGVDASSDEGPFPLGAKGTLVSLRSVTRLAGLPPASASPDITLPDLLKFLSRSGRAVALVVKSRTEEGRISFEGGRLIHAELGKVTGDKALYRILAWPEVSFEVQKLPPAESVRRSIDIPFDTLIAEGLQQAEEMEKLSTLLPPQVVPLRLNENCPLALSELSPAEMEIFQEVIRHQTLSRILEASPMTDFRILSLIWGLLKKKVFTFSAGSSDLLEETYVHRPS